MLSGADAPAGEEAFRSRHIAHPDHRRARAWLREALEEAIGEAGTVREEPFAYGGYADLANLVADLPGADPDAGWVLVSAHLDSIASFDDGWVEPAWDPAPGADDDASGCAAVLEIGRALAAGTRAAGVRLVLFDAEEEGLQGASAHAASLGIPIERMYQLDPVGFDPDGLLWVVYDPRWPEVAEELQASGLSGLRVEIVDRGLIGGDERSDHAPFWAEGVPAVHLASFPQPPTYHTMGDTMDNVSPAYTREVAGLVLAEVAALSGAELPDVVEAPGPGGCGCASGARPAAGWLALLYGIRAARGSGRGRRRSRPPTPA